MSSWLCCEATMSGVAGSVAVHPSGQAPAFRTAATCGRRARQRGAVGPSSHLDREGHLGRRERALVPLVCALRALRRRVGRHRRSCIPLHQLQPQGGALRWTRGLPGMPRRGGLLRSWCLGWRSRRRPVRESVSPRRAVAAGLTSIRTSAFCDLPKAMARRSAVWPSEGRR